jgi:membrane-bound metal-dependent hydrolase YbcI (DUF457 family)
MIKPRQHNLLVASFTAVYFIIFSLPIVYETTSKISSSFMQGGAPSVIGITIHALVAFLAMYMTMSYLVKEDEQKS